MPFRVKVSMTLAVLPKSAHPEVASRTDQTNEPTPELEQRRVMRGRLIVIDLANQLLSLLQSGLGRRMLASLDISRHFMKSNAAPILPLSPGATPRRSLPKEMEELLIDRILRGRTDAFADLVQPYLVSLNRFAQRRLGSEAEADDVVQQSILLAFSHLGQFRRDASFSTWLRAIAINEVFRLLQRRTGAHLPLGEPLEVHLADPASSPYTQCEQRERAERLHKALTRLPEKYRLMIQLRDLGELSIDETAESLSLSSSAVRTRHHRARKLLARSLRREQLAKPVSPKCM